MFLLSTLLFLAFLIQLLFWGLVFGRFAFSKKREHKAQARQGVSVVVAARNELQNLKNLLPALLQQDYPNFEVIVVNDRSEDKTATFLATLSAAHQQIKVLNIEQKPETINGKKYALLQGIGAAQFEILLLTDADCLPASRTWIDKMQAPFVKKEIQIVLGYSPYQKQKGFLNLCIQYETLYTAIQYLSFAFWKMPYMGVGRNLAYRKSFFEKTRGFDAILNITGGDDDLFVGMFANKNNTAVVFEKEAQSISRPKTTWTAWFAQKKRHLSVGKHYPNTHKLKLAALHSSHFFLFALVALTALFFPNQAQMSLILWGIRTFALCLCFVRIGRKLATPVPIQFVPLLDVLYLAYFILTGLAALTTRITWTKKINDSSPTRL